MICPKCEKGDVEEVRMRSTGKKAFLCDFCESLWFKGEIIDINTDHRLQSFSRGEEIENITRSLGNHRI